MEFKNTMILNWDGINKHRYYKLKLTIINLYTEKIQ